MPLEIGQGEMAEFRDELVEQDSLVHRSGRRSEFWLFSAPPIRQEAFDLDGGAGLIAEQQCVLRPREGLRVVEGAVLNRAEDGRAMSLGTLQVSGGGLELDLLATPFAPIGEGDFDRR